MSFNLIQSIFGRPVYATHERIKCERSIETSMWMLACQHMCVSSARVWWEREHMQNGTSVTRIFNESPRERIGRRQVNGNVQGAASQPTQKPTIKMKYYNWEIYIFEIFVYVCQMVVAAAGASNAFHIRDTISHTHTHTDAYQTVDNFRSTPGLEAQNHMIFIQYFVKFIFIRTMVSTKVSLCVCVWALRAIHAFVAPLLFFLFRRISLWNMCFDAGTGDRIQRMQRTDNEMHDVHFCVHESFFFWGFN